MYGYQEGKEGWDELGDWDFPGKNTGVGCHALLQAIMLTQGSNQMFSVSPAWAEGFFTTAPPGKTIQSLSIS